MFGETTISQEKVWNHPIETTIKIWLFRVTGRYPTQNPSTLSMLSFASWCFVMIKWAKLGQKIPTQQRAKGRSKIGDG